MYCQKSQRFVTEVSHFWLVNKNIRKTTRRELELQSNSTSKTFGYVYMLLQYVQVFQTPHNYRSVIFIISWKKMFYHSTTLTTIFCTDCYYTAYNYEAELLIFWSWEVQKHIIGDSICLDFSTALKLQ